MLNKISINTKYIGKSIIYKPICCSTNSLSFNIRYRKKIKNENIILTDYQYKGKGQKKKKWVTKKYKDVTLSLIMYPFYLKTEKNFYLNIITITVIKKVLFKYRIKIKWPNDIYYKKKKINGNLIENKIKFKKIKKSVIGIGININKKKNSLLKVKKKKIKKEKKIKKILKKLEFYYYK